MLMLVLQIVPMSAATVYDGEFIHRFHHLQQVLTHMAAQKLHSIATAPYQPVCQNHSGAAYPDSPQ